MRGTCLPLTLAIQVRIDHLYHALRIQSATEKLVYAINIRLRIENQLVVTHVNPLDVRLAFYPPIHLVEVFLKEAA